MIICLRNNLVKNQVRGSTEINNTDTASIQKLKVKIIKNIIVLFTLIRDSGG